MDPWLNQIGFPFITVKRSEDGTATVTQKQFLFPPSQTMNVESPWNYRWTIPLTVVTAGSDQSEWDGRPTDWFNINDTELILSGLPTNLNDWVIVNPLQRFFYRVLYDENNHAAIVSQLVADHTKIDHQSRAQFIEDSFALARASYAAEFAAMETTRYLGNERSYNPWNSALKYTSLSYSMLNGTALQDSFASYMLSQITPVYEALGWSFSPYDTPDDQQFRRAIIGKACDYGLTDCLELAQALFQLYSQNPSINSVNANILPTVLCTGVAEGTNEDWNIVVNQYQLRRTSQITSERASYLKGASCTTNEQLIDTYLSIIVRGVEIPSRDQYRATLYLSQNPIGAEKLWTYFDNSWTTVPSGLNKFTILQRMTETFATQEGLDKLNALIAKYPPANDSQWSLFNQMTLRVQQNIKWFTDNSDSLGEWLEANGPSTSSTTSRRSPLPVSTADFWSSLATTENSQY